MNTIVVLMVVAAASAILWRVLSKKRDAEKVAAYECPHCGERHCDCYRTDDAKRPEKD